PLFGAKRGPGCGGRWWLVGPLAWACSDDVLVALDDPTAPEVPLGVDGTPHPYFFVGREGARAYASLDLAQEGTPDHDLEAGWAVAVGEQRVEQGERWGRTTKGLWVAMRDLAAAPPTTFHGEAIADGTLDVAWVVADRAGVWASPSATGKGK